MALRGIRIAEVGVRFPPGPPNKNIHPRGGYFCLPELGNRTGKGSGKRKFSRGGSVVETEGFEQSFLHGRNLILSLRPTLRSKFENNFEAHILD